MTARAAFVAVALLLLPLIGNAQAQSSGCGSLMSSINQLRAQIPHEPRDAAQADQQAVNTYVSLYNRGCVGGGSGPSSGFPRGGGANNAANALGAGAMALSDLADLLDQLDQAERQNAAAQQQAILEEALRDAEERAALAKARTAAAAAKAGDDAKREAMANPFGSGSNPFAATASAPATQPAPKSSSSGASRAITNGSGASYGPPNQQWVKNPTPENCAAASPFEKNTAGWYDSCVAPNQANGGGNLPGGDGNGPGGGKMKLPKPRPGHGGPTVAGPIGPGGGNGLPGNNAPGAGNGGPGSDECTGTRDALGACWIIPPRDLPVAANDDGLECGAYGGRRSRGQCVAPWDNQTETDCIKNVGGTYYPADDDHAYSTCAYDAPANPETTDDGPDDGQACGDAGGITHHHGQCWALGLTHEDCASLGGTIVDSGGFQYCAYDAAAADAAAPHRPATAKQGHGLRDRLGESLRNADTQPPAGSAPSADTAPIAQGLGHTNQNATQTSIGAVQTQPSTIRDSLHPPPTRPTE